MNKKYHFLITFLIITISHLLICSSVLAQQITVPPKKKAETTVKKTESSTPKPTYGSLTDSRDGKTYKTVKIGTQTWMAENLCATSYNDGTPITLVTDNIAWQNLWQNLTTAAYCWYNNDEAKYKNIYGALYNWYPINTGKICPVNWHVPTNKEWTILTTYLGGKNVAGGKLKSTTGWDSPNKGATNSSGFNALPSGYRSGPSSFGGNGETSGSGYRCSWWSSSLYENSTSSAWSTTLENTSEVYIDWDNKLYGFSVRCIKD